MKLIGRDTEQKLIEGMLKAGRHVLLEGPVGVGKTTLALAVAEKLNRTAIRIDGDGRYTEQKLVGSFDPKIVMEKGFVRESFIPGPLYQAMEAGELFLINELNRMPEMVQNVLLPALDDGKIQIPVLGELRAQAGFAVIATQNPREFVATSPLSEALLDRMEWVSIAPFSSDEEIEIVKAHLQTDTNSYLPNDLQNGPATQTPKTISTEVIAEVVTLMRLTRTHAKVKRGASVRAAIAMIRILQTTDADFWAIAKSVIANRIELEIGKFSSRPYSDLLDELILELKSELKKKALKSRSSNPARANHTEGTLLYHADSVADTDDEEQAGETSPENSGGEQNDPSGHDKKDDWDFAVRFRDIQRYGYLEPKLKKEMSEKAIRSIIHRAHAALGPIQKPYRYQLAEIGHAEALSAQGATVELAIEESLEAREMMFQARIEKNYGLVLLLDTSLSMKGEKLAFLGVTIAAVAASIPSRALCILGFDSEIHALKEFNEVLSPEVLIARVLSIPPGGFTNIELGLNTARVRLQNGIYPRARVIIVSDGRYTEGKHPVEIAKYFQFLYPVKLGKDPGGRAIMKEMAETGLGRFSEVREMKELPKFLLNAIRSWVK